MNSGGHTGLGILFYIIASKLIGAPITPTGILLAALFSLLPDIDIVLSYFVNIEHRKITHKPIFAVPTTIIIMFFDIPLAASFFSHYLADYVYESTLEKLVPIAPGNTVSSAEYYSAALLGVSIVYSLILLHTENKWLPAATAIALFFITMTELAAKKKK